jgi:hypothetical protein
MAWIVEDRKKHEYLDGAVARYFIEQDSKIIAFVVEDENEAANARMIAAAPEMFKTLRAMMRAVPHQLKASDAFNAAWGEALQLIIKVEDRC